MFFLYRVNYQEERDTTGAANGMPSRLAVNDAIFV